MPATDIGIARSRCHGTAMQFTLAVIDMIVVAHANPSLPLQERNACEEECALGGPTPVTEAKRILARAAKAEKTEQGRGPR